MTSVSLQQPRWRDLNADQTDTRLTLALASARLIDVRLERCSMAYCLPLKPQATTVACAAFFGNGRNRG